MDGLVQNAVLSTTATRITEDRSAPWLTKDTSTSNASVPSNCLGVSTGRLFFARHEQCLLLAACSRWSRCNASQRPPEYRSALTQSLRDCEAVARMAGREIACGKGSGSGNRETPTWLTAASGRDRVIARITIPYTAVAEKVSATLLNSTILPCASVVTTESGRLPARSDGAIGGVQVCFALAREGRISAGVPHCRRQIGSKRAAAFPTRNQFYSRIALELRLAA